MVLVLKEIGAPVKLFALPLRFTDCDAPLIVILIGPGVLGYPGFKRPLKLMGDCP